MSNTPREIVSGLAASRSPGKHEGTQPPPPSKSRFCAPRLVMSHLLHGVISKFCVSRIPKPVYRRTGGVPAEQ